MSHWQNVDKKKCRNLNCLKDFFWNNLVCILLFGIFPIVLFTFRCFVFWHSATLTIKPIDIPRFVIAFLNQKHRTYTVLHFQNEQQHPRKFLLTFLGHRSHTAYEWLRRKHRSANWKCPLWSLFLCFSVVYFWTFIKTVFGLHQCSV